MVSLPPPKSKTSGVYKITCVPSGNCYIGSSADIRKRWQQHHRQLRLRTHDNPHFQRACDKYGTEAFVFEIIEIVSDKQLLLSREQFYLDALKPALNCLPTAGSCAGRIHSQETKDKISAAHKGRPWSPQHLSIHRAAQRSKVITPEHRSKMTAGRVGKKRGPLSAERITKLRQGAARWRAANPVTPKPPKPKPRMDPDQVHEIRSRSMRARWAKVQTKETRPCFTCGKDVTRIPSRFRTERTFCSWRCASLAPKLMAQEDGRALRGAGRRSR